VVSEHAPYVFDEIRQLIGIDRDSYQRSIGPEGMLGNLLLGYLNSMTELGAQGGSGSLFYLTPDSHYLVKTIREDEFEIAFKSLKSYHEHLKRNTNTLIYKITGLYKIETYMNKKNVDLYICIMKNIFTDLHCSKVYDLKGSTNGRKAKKDGKTPIGILKDLDWASDKQSLKLDKGLQSFISQILESDTNYLKSLNVMDYSLLVGIHPISGKPDAYIASLKRPEDDKDSYKNGVKKAIHNRFRGGVISADKSCIYILAIIDLFTFYSAKKKAENFFKTIAFMSGISAVEPEVYAARFRSFITKQFA